MVKYNDKAKVSLRFVNNDNVDLRRKKGAQWILAYLWFWNYLHWKEKYHPLSSLAKHTPCNSFECRIFLRSILTFKFLISCGIFNYFNARTTYFVSFEPRFWLKVLCWLHRDSLGMGQINKCAWHVFCIGFQTIDFVFQSPFWQFFNWKCWTSILKWWPLAHIIFTFEKNDRVSIGYGLSLKDLISLRISSILMMIW